MGASNLCNVRVYLHHVMDMWWEGEVRPRLRGRSALVRYADDIVLAFEYEEDARRVMDVLPRRFEKYGLRLNSSKTRLVNFKKPKDSNRNSDEEHEASSFDFLGFCHYWATSGNGYLVCRVEVSA